MNRIQKENLSKTPRRGAGRPKGSPNKTSALLKDAILKAAEDAGGGKLETYLKEQAIKNPAPFLSLLGKVLPLQLTGDKDNPIAHSLSWLPPQ
jgi:hypothetical protein